MKPIYSSLIIIATWGVWPILARMSGLPNGWITVGTSGISAALALGFVLLAGKVQSLEMTLFQKGCIASIGILNAIGIVFYGKLLERGDAMTYVVLAMVFIPIVTSAGMAMVFHEEMTYLRAGGLILVAIGMFLFLNK